MAETIQAHAEQGAAPRSFHFIPATLLECLDSANLEAIGADTYVFDLEDPVRPEDKESARTWLSEFIDSGKIPRRLSYCVRLNMPASEWWDDDFRTFNGRVPIMIPRLSSIQEIPIASESEIIPLIETIPSLDLMPEFETLNSDTEGKQKISTVLLGKEDLSAELGHINTDPDSSSPIPSTDLRENPVMRGLFEYLRWGTSHHLHVYDGVSNKLGDLGVAAAASLTEECAYARQLGAAGKLSIHPSQVATINRTFNASNAVVVERRPGIKPELIQDISDVPNLDAKLRTARRIVEVFESNQRAQITTVLEIDGIKRMIGPPAYRLAQTILARA